MGPFTNNKNDLIDHMKIILVGIYPPPFGGVAVHLKRLLHGLKESCQISLIDVSKIDSNEENVINMTESKMLFYLFFKQEKSIVHFHIFSVKLVMALFLLSLRHRTIITFHNERFIQTLKSSGILIFHFSKFLMNYVHHVIVLNDKCKKLAEQIIKDKTKIKILPNFIPLQNVPSPNEEIIRFRKKHEFVLSSNAWKICFYNGEDLYGIDLLIELTKRLRLKYDVVFLFLLPDIGEMAYFNKLNKQIQNAGIKKHFIFITKPVSGPGIWKISDLVIRATNTDVTSLSVQEALSLNTPVIASNCVERPEHTILFESRNSDDLFEKTKYVLANLEKHKKKIVNDSTENTVELYQKLYEEITP